MNKTKIIVALIIGAVLVGGGVLIFKNREVGISDSDMVVEKHTESEEAMIKQEATTALGVYENYDAEKVAFYAEKHKVVIFFHAVWCPYCIATDADIRKNLSQIPDDVAILIADYDSSVALKKKYGVTYQHTFVQVDKDGNLIKKWGDSDTLSDVLLKIKR